MPLPARLDAWQQARPTRAVPIAAVYKFIDDQGGYLAALMAYYGFLSLFPLLLLATTILGFVLAGDPELQRSVLHSALSQFPIVGDELRSNLGALKGSTAGLIFGLLGSVYGSISVAQAAQNAFNTVWMVPRAHRPNAIKSRVRSLLTTALLGLGLLVTIGLSSLASGLGSLGATGAWTLVVAVIAVVVAVAGNTGLFLLGFRLLTARTLSLRQLLPGALLAGVVWQVLETVGTYYLGHNIKHASALYGLFGLVLGLLGWLYLGALLAVLACEVNVTLAEGLYPRSLLAPFTDAHLTPADKQAYTELARTQQLKPRERVETSFEPAESSASQP